MIRAIIVMRSMHAPHNGKLTASSFSLLYMSWPKHHSAIQQPFHSSFANSCVKSSSHELSLAIQAAIMPHDAQLDIHFVLCFTDSCDAVSPFVSKTLLAESCISFPPQPFAARSHRCLCVCVSPWQSSAAKDPAVQCLASALAHT